ncbi:MAG: hypothetical protein KGL46_07240 [Hyphomicrobiales bacterium]|nr:hypothetical protein [Hyphomicrobiales bacterium]
MSLAPVTLSSDLARDRKGFAFTRADLLTLVALAALFLIVHPFIGLIGDSKIYMGRALADVDPTGVGRDMMFQLDGQSKFSLFPLIAARLVGLFTPQAAAQILVLVAQLFWFSALIFFCRVMVGARWWAPALVIIVAPSLYSPYNLLKYAEAFAEPRPFAEAGVIAAMGFLRIGRPIPALACLALAALFHPIMAAPGVAVFGVYLVMHDRRWLIAVAFAFAALAAGVVAGLPLVARLREWVDPQWLDILLNRSAYIFPHVWPAQHWALAGAQAVTIAVAMARANASARGLLGAALAVGAAGVALAWICGALAPVLLVIQAQTWRMWWLASFMAAFSLGWLAVLLGRGSAQDRIALALLVLGWVRAPAGDFLAPALAIGALALQTPAGRKLNIGNEASKWIEIALWGVALAAAFGWIGNWRVFASYFQPGYTPRTTELFVALWSELLLIGALAVAAFSSGLEEARTKAGGPLAVCLAGLAIFAWRSDDSFQRQLDKAQPQQALLQLMPDAHGETLWLKSSSESWFWLRRPNWIAEIQGAGGVFSRRLTMQYDERARAAIASGVAGEEMLGRWTHKLVSYFPPLPAQGVAALCARSDGPRYIVAPVADPATLDPALKARIWRAPAARVEPMVSEKGVRYERLEDYAVMDCANWR